MREREALSKEGGIFYLFGLALLIGSIWLGPLLLVAMLALIVSFTWDIRISRKRRQVDLIMAELKGMQIVMEEVLNKIEIKGFK